MFQSHQLSHNLYEARKRMGISQRTLAEKLYVSAQSVSKWERDEAVPDLEHLCNLSALLHISVDEAPGHSLCLDPMDTPGRSSRLSI